MNKKINTAFILAAGFGTRLKPLTDNLPKALVEYHGKPMIETVIAKITGSGVEKILINIHHHADKMKKYFNSRTGNENITLIEEAGILGTGGAVKNAEKYLKDEGSFIIYNTDVDTDAELNPVIDCHFSNKPLATLLVQTRKTSRYLICDSEGNVNGRVEDGKNVFYKERVNVNDLNYKAFCGIHIVSSDIFTLLPSSDNVYDIIPVYMAAIGKNYTIKGYDISSYKWKDLGIPQNL